MNILNLIFLLAVIWIIAGAVSWFAKKMMWLAIIVAVAITFYAMFLI